MQCAATRMVVGTKNGGRHVGALNVHVTRFEKIACEKAQGKAGYVCDYVHGFGTNMQNQSADSLSRGGSVTQARFVRRGDGWILLGE